MAMLRRSAHQSSIYGMDRAELNVIDMYDSSNGNEQPLPSSQAERALRQSVSHNPAAAGAGL
jgi:hypothetical protein